MSNLLRDYVALSQFNYIYPFGTLPSNLFFRKPNPLPYYASNEMKNTKISLSKKPTSIEVDMTVDTSVGPAVVDTGNTHIVSSSTKSLVGPYIDTCGDKTSVQYNYKIIAENTLTGDVTADGHAKVAFDLKNTPLPAAFIKNHVKLIKQGHMMTSICAPCDPEYKPGFSGELIFQGKDANGAVKTTTLNLADAKHASCPGSDDFSYEISGARLIFKWKKTHSVETVATEMIASIVEETRSSLLSIEDPFNIDAIAL